MEFFLTAAGKKNRSFSADNAAGARKFADKKFSVKKYRYLSLFEEGKTIVQGFERDYSKSWVRVHGDWFRPVPGKLVPLSETSDDVNDEELVKRAEQKV